MICGTFFYPLVSALKYTFSPLKDKVRNLTRTPTNKNGKGVQIVRNWRSPVAIWLACIELIFRELQ